MWINKVTYAAIINLAQGRNKASGASSLLVLLIASVGLIATPSRAQDETKPAANANADPNAGRTQTGAETDRQWIEDEIKFQEGVAAHFSAIIAPTLQQNCFQCHLSDSVEIGGNFYFDMGPPNAWQGRSGRTIIPGNPKNSLLIQVLRGDGVGQMPPDAKLAKEIIDEFAKWIKNGAIVPDQVPENPYTRAPAPALDPVMKLFDKNGDGVISEQEQSKSGMALAGFDKNGDGQITADETPNGGRGNFFYDHSYSMYGNEPFTHTGVLRSNGPPGGYYGGYISGWDGRYDQTRGGGWSSNRTWTDRNGKMWNSSGGSWSDPQREEAERRWRNNDNNGEWIRTRSPRWQGENNQQNGQTGSQGDNWQDPRWVSPGRQGSGFRADQGDGNSRRSSGDSSGNSAEIERQIRELQSGGNGQRRGSGRQTQIQGGSK